jgi:hypothetical protein
MACLPPMNTLYLFRRCPHYRLQRDTGASGEASRLSSGRLGLPIVSFKMLNISSFILHLIQFDCWYASYLAVHHFLRPEDVYIIPPCDERLFQAKTLEKWNSMRPDFSEMDYSVISASQQNLAPNLASPGAIVTQLLLLQLRLGEANSLLNRTHKSDEACAKVMPWKEFADDIRSKPLINITANLALAADGTARDFDINCAISWHASCIGLGTYLPTFEAAAGRSGPTAAETALKEISIWANTPSARRSCLHSAQIFRLLLHRRFSEPIRLHSMIALFQASLVLGLYIFTMSNPGSGDLFDLYDDEIAWQSVGQIGISQDSTDILPSGIWSMPAVRFILGGGRICLADSVIKGGYKDARKCWLHFASLMLSLGRWKSRVFSRILHVMCDNLSDMDSSNAEHAHEYSD